MSNFDKLHDQFFSTSNKKAGTRYERLVAVLFKLLEEDNIVIHDIKLIGKDTGVKHQIDVKVDTSRGKKHILIECKDFDTSKEKVDLERIRNFFGVVDDVKPDEAFVISTEGFTKPAKQYAKGKNIKLAIFRDFKPKDYEERTITSILNLHIIETSIPIVSLCIYDDETERLIVQYLKDLNINPAKIRKSDSIYIMENGNTIQLIEYAEMQIAKHNITDAGKKQIGVDFIQEKLVIGQNQEITIPGIIINFEVKVNTENYSYTSDRIAKLIFNDFSNDDLIVFEDELKRYTIEINTGEVINTSNSSDVK